MGKQKDCLIISMFSKNETPYASYYIDELEQQGATYDIAYFERYDMDRTPDKNELLFSRYCPTGGSKFRKLGTMVSYARWIRSLVKSDKYSSIIVLTTVPAVMLKDLLTKKYCCKYILDIRDYTYEGSKLYYGAVEDLIAHSFATVLSSRGFLDFLPKCDAKYVYTHNIAKGYDKAGAFASQKNIYNIGFVGSIRYFNENSRLIDLVQKHPKYHLSYYGTQSNGCDLKDYCRQNGYANVLFGGPFDNAEKPEIYKSIDVINSIYGVAGLETTTAIPNRLYDAAIYGCPIIVSKGTYLAECVNAYKLGIAVNVLDEDIFEALDLYLENFSQEDFEDGRLRLLDDVEKDMEEARMVLRSFISETLNNGVAVEVQ